MMNLSSDVIRAYQGRTIATAESCTGGMIGAALTAVSGSSAVYKGGVISYWSQVKEELLAVDGATLSNFGAVSSATAMEMAEHVRTLLKTDAAVSVTGLAGPDGDGSANPVGTVFVGFANEKVVIAREYHFNGDRQQIRQQAVIAALNLLLEMQ